MSPSRVQEQPCVEITCDGCGEGDNEYGDSWHYKSLAEAIESVEGMDWRVERDEAGEPVAFYCFGCWEQRAEERCA